MTLSYVLSKVLICMSTIMTVVISITQIVKKLFGVYMIFPYDNSLQQKKNGQYFINKKLLFCLQCKVVWWQIDNSVDGAENILHFHSFN